MKLNYNGFNFCNYLFPLGLMIIYAMKVIFLKCQILVFVFYWNVKNVKVNLMVNVKMATLSAKFVLKTHKYFSKGSLYSFK